MRPVRCAAFVDDRAGVHRRCRNYAKPNGFCARHQLEARIAAEAAHG